MDTKTRDDWARAAGELTLPNQAFIGGEYVDAVSGETFDDISRIAGTFLTAVASCDAEDVDQAVVSARGAFEDGRWSGLSPSARRGRLLAFAELMRTHTDELALMDTLDAGKPISDTTNGDVPFSADGIQYFAEAIDKIYGEVAPTDPSVVALVTPEPMGVVGAVVPWNFPLNMAVWKLGPALATGNSVVLKPAEQSPLSALRIASLAVEAGIPEGVLNVVPGFGETAGAALGRHHDVDMISFTGSTEVGKLFLKYSAESNMKLVAIESGGKSPNIVMADLPNIDIVAQTAARGIFFNQGEVCNAGSRLVVHTSRREELLERLMHYANDYQPMDPLDPEARMGAVVDEDYMDRVLGYVRSGLSDGADLRMGGERVRVETGGFYVEPTVFDGVTNDMQIAREEIFGPVLSVIAFEEPEEAVRIANDSKYGLAAAGWTKDIDLAFSMAKSLRAGIVCVNCFSFGDHSVPFGGFKQTGSSRDQSLHALEKYTQLKTIWINTQTAP